MTFSTQVTEIIEQLGENQVKIQALLDENLSGTISADTGDAPVYDEVTGLWTCAQSTANANGEYLGIYKLPLGILCAILDQLDIIAFTAPQPPNTPARLLPCGADPLTGWTNLPALVDLEGEAFNQFEIRSATPFEVKARVAAAPEEWCYDFDFTVSNGGWTVNAGAGNWVSGQGWTGMAFGTGGGISGLQKSFSNTLLTSVTVVHSASGFSATQKEIWYQKDSDPIQYHVLTDSAAAFNMPNVSTVDDFSPSEVDHIELYWGGASSYDCTLKSVTIRGTGANPFGTGNCS